MRSIHFVCLATSFESFSFHFLFVDFARDEICLQFDGHQLATQAIVDAPEYNSRYMSICSADTKPFIHTLTPYNEVCVRVCSLNRIWFLVMSCLIFVSSDRKTVAHFETHQSKQQNHKRSTNNFVMNEN